MLHKTVWPCLCVRTVYQIMDDYLGDGVDALDDKIAACLRDEPGKSDLTSKCRTVSTEKSE